jgi:GT2 family glycosyltransferase
MTLVSVIIPTHNRSALLKQAIESVLAVQSDDIELGVLVVDDGSVDDTAEAVKNHPVIYLRQRGGLGPSGTRNAGLDAAHGEYVAFLDDDDLWLPTNLTHNCACCANTLGMRWYLPKCGALRHLQTSVHSCIARTQSALNAR